MIRTVIKYTDNKILLNDAEVFETSKKLFPGMYDMEFDQYQQFKNFIYMNNPKVFPLMPSDELENVQSYMDKFFSKEYTDLCKKAGILVKSGLLLYGEAGIGKSNYINYLINETIKEKNSCVFNVDTSLKLLQIVPLLKQLREIQDNLFVVVLEEIDELFGAYQSGSEAVLKNLMDGVNSVDNLLFLSSTNYIENIPKSLTSRPSRFKKVFEIKQTEDMDKMKEWLEKTYKVFIEDLTKDECEKLHEVCLNRTIDDIKHTLIDYKLNITEVKKKNKIGFGKK